MATRSDPSFHQAAERRLIEHATRLLDDPRLVVDTTTGRRPVTALMPEITRSDHGVDLKRMMTDLNVADRALQEQMPIGEMIDVVLSRKNFFFFKKTIGQVRIVSTSPTRQLLKGEKLPPMESSDIEKLLKAMPAPAAKVPVTTVLLSTSGFAHDARLLADRTAERTLILLEPNDAGGWTVHGPVETKALVDLFDLEGEEAKRDRVRAEIESAKFDLLTGSIASDRIAAKTQLPLQLVEAEVKSYAKENAGLVARRLDGRMVLYREGSSPLPASSSSAGAMSSAAADAGGSDMPLIDRIKSLFGRKGDNEKKVAFLSERRAALSQQRDRAYEEISALEAKDDELRDQFKKARAPLTKRRVTSQLVQLRKDIERRQQMITVLNQQVNVVSTHLHNLELSKQGDSAQLPDSEEIATDAAAAEEMLAQLQADSELADSVGGTTATAGMSEEEQALFEELEAESGGKTPAAKLDHAETPEDLQDVEAPEDVKEPAKKTGRKAEPEAG